MRKKNVSLLFVLILMSIPALPFCGFYVAQAGASLFNNKSQVILVRDGKLTTLTMSNDFKGNVEKFAMVVPVPEVLRERDIKVIGMDIFDKLDAYSAPRLAEYYDPEPCYRYDYRRDIPMSRNMEFEVSEGLSLKDKAPTIKTVKIEASYSIGEYDMLILSGTESKDLKLWLQQNGYALPENAEEVLDPYIKNNLKFFVVKVNLERKSKSEFANLRPIQITYESDRFMLPIRLGMANANGEQDLVVYAFTKTGRIECANYRTVKIPSNRSIPTFVKNDFGDFYTHLFNKTYKEEGRNTVFLEYAWNVSPTFGGMKCDPCVGPPPILGELKTAGVHWIQENNMSDVFFTRLHVRYTRDKFAQDLLFTVTPNREHFQGRYVITNPATGDMSCEEGKSYLLKLQERKRNELTEYLSLTGKQAANYLWYAPEIAPKQKEIKTGKATQTTGAIEKKTAIRKDTVTHSDANAPTFVSGPMDSIANESESETSSNFPIASLTVLLLPMGITSLLWAFRKKNNE